MCELINRNDPVAETIHALNSWRFDNPDEAITIADQELGIRAFEVVLFSVRPKTMQELIGDIAVRNHVVVTE